MFGLISKKRLLKEMNSIKEGNRKEKNGAKYPPKTEEQKTKNLFLQGYECGHDNFYNGLKARLKL